MHFDLFFSSSAHEARRRTAATSAKVKLPGALPVFPPPCLRLQSDIFLWSLVLLLEPPVLTCLVGAGQCEASAG